MSPGELSHTLHASFSGSDSLVEVSIFLLIFGWLNLGYDLEYSTAFV